MKFQAKNFVFACGVFVLTLAVSAVSAYAQNTFDGKSAYINVNLNGGSCAVNFSGDNPYVRRLSGTTGRVQVVDCTNPNTSLGYISSAGEEQFINGNWVVTNTKGLQIQRETSDANGKAGYWCFKTSDTVVDITYTPNPTTQYWRWFANNNNSGFYNVKDFGAKGDNNTDDAFAIKNAVTYIAGKLGGTLLFPEGIYRVNSSIDLPSGIIIKGTSGMSSQAYNNYASMPSNSSVYPKGRTNSTIMVTGSNKSLFRIGECVDGVKITNINLTADSTTGTNGVEAVGRYADPDPEVDGRSSTSQRFSFENVAFTAFNKGIYVRNAVPEEKEDPDDYLWHFDYVSVDNCAFIYNKSAGIHVSTYNTDWRISSSFFFLTSLGASGTGTRSDGITIDQGGAFMIENTFGGGAGDSANTRGGTFIKATAVGSLTVVNSSGERAMESISYGTNYGSLSNTLTLINNNFGDPININGRVNFVSTGNQYMGKTVNVNTSPAGIARIYSTGDRFCMDLVFAYDQNAPCGRDSNGVAVALNQAGFQGNGVIVFQTGQPKDQKLGGTNGTTVVQEIASIPNRMKGDLEINGNDREELNNPVANTRPILSVTVDNDGLTPIKPLIRMGHNPFVYNIERDLRGWLKFSGTQDKPYRGFYFEDAPFQLPAFTLTEITSTNFGQAQAGTVVYCSNCNPNTAPCTSGGSGSLALLNGAGAWHCK
jgi:hypothetical protein